MLCLSSTHAVSTMAWDRKALKHAVQWIYTFPVSKGLGSIRDTGELPGPQRAQGTKPWPCPTIQRQPHTHHLFPHLDAQARAEAPVGAWLQPPEGWARRVTPLLQGAARLWQRSYTASDWKGKGLSSKKQTCSDGGGEAAGGLSLGVGTEFIRKPVV